MEKLVEKLSNEGYIKSDKVKRAFLNVDRAKFVPEDLQESAYSNIPLPIGKSQTISQPLTVAFMLELLDVSAGQNVLDVGSGSGWTTGLLSYIVGEEGRVVAIEYDEDIYEQGKENLKHFDFFKKGIAEMHCGDGRKGYPKYEPYDRILVSAMAEDIPEELKKQLKVGGKMAIPIKDSIFLIKKRGEEEFETEKFQGFAFVPLVEG